MARPQLHSRLAKFGGARWKKAAAQLSGEAGWKKAAAQLSGEAGWKKATAQSSRGAGWKRGGKGVQTEELQDLGCSGPGWKRVSITPFFFRSPSVVSRSTVYKDEFIWDWIS